MAAKPATPRFLHGWGRHGDAPGEFDIPIDLAINDRDEVIVTDFRNRRVQVFSTDGELLACCPVLSEPGGLALDDQGHWYVSHFGFFAADDQRKPDRITVWSPAGEFLREWGRTGQGDGEFDFPGGLAIRGARVYAADQTNRRVQVFDLAGRFLMKWGEYGLAEGQFGGCDVPQSRVAGPNFLAFDTTGHLYTTEASMGRIQKFTAEGEFVLSWGSLEIEPGGFGGPFLGFAGEPPGLKGPIAVVADRHDRLWISSVNGRVQQYDATGRFLRGLDPGQGTAPGQLLAPHGLALDSHGRLYVADSFNHRIQVYEVPE